MTIVVDIVLVLIVAIAAYVGYRKGAVKMLLSFLIVILALVGAFVASGPLANAGYSLLFEQSVSQTVDAALENTTQDAVEGAVENLFSSNSLVGGVGSLVGFDTQKVVNQVVDEPLESIGTVIKEEIVKPPVVLLLRCISFLLLFALLWIILFFIFKALSKTTKIPVIKGFNALAGGFVGMIVGVLLCFALSMLLGFITRINPNGLFGITEITKENSVVYRFLLQLVTVIVK